MSKGEDDLTSRIRAGVMRHIVGANRVAARRAVKASARGSQGAVVRLKHSSRAKPAAVAEPARAGSPAPAAQTADKRRMPKITDAMISAAARMRPAKKTRQVQVTRDIFNIYQPPPGVLPKGKTAKIAMDEAMGSASAFGMVQSWGFDGLGSIGAMFEEGIGFLGYSYLALLTQRPEYRKISERTATEMTREWIELQVTDSDDEAEQADEEDETDGEEGEEAGGGAEPGAAKAKPPKAGKPPAVDGGKRGKKGIATDEDLAAAIAAAIEGGGEDDLLGEDDKTEKLKQLEDELERHKIRDLFRNIAEYDGWFGRSHIYVDIDDAALAARDLNSGAEELKTSIGNGRDAASYGKVEQGTKLQFKNVEAMWAYPATYEAVNPLLQNWYRPETWYCNGIEVHRTRLLTFIGREVPDILKPAYAFGGLSMSQMAKPYVDNWLRTRQAVADLIESFSVSGIYSNLAGWLEDAGEGMAKRVDLFNQTRSNAGAFLLDKETEEFFNVSTPLGTLDALQAQSQEQMSSVTGIPLVVLLGITPKGLNASSEGEIRVFYDWIKAYQESFFRDHLQTVIELIQLSLWGEIDDEITFAFKPLWSMTEKEKGEVDKAEAEADQIRIDSGVLDPAEVRKAVAAKPGSRYADINVADVPDPPADPMGEEGSGDDPFGGGGGDDDGGKDPEGGGANPFSSGSGEGAQDEAIFEASLAEDDGWDEGKHPRSDNGQFGAGSGGSGGKSASPAGSAASEKKTSPYKTTGKTNWNGQPHSDPTTMDTLQLETGIKTLQHTIKNSPFTHAQRALREERLADLKTELGERSKSTSKKALKPSDLKQEGGKLGSNAGGTFTDKSGQKFYIKKPASKEHVANERAAARLYQLAGVNTLDYHDVEGGEHVATKWEKLDKNNIADMTPAERKEAAKDFMVHAWLSNWDAAGTGGDNQGMRGGKPVTLDVGGSLRFRAQGGPKGAAFGPKVGEIETMRNQSMSPDAAQLFGKMSDADLKASAERVTSISDDDIRKAAGDDELADTLIARKADIAKRYGIAQDEWLHPDVLSYVAGFLELEPEEVAPDVFVAQDENQFDESKIKRDQDGKFSSTGGGSSSSGAAEVGKSFKTKKEHIAHLLTNGITPKELMSAMGWPSVSMPAQAASLGMKLEKKDGKYFGTKMTEAELAAAKKAAAEKKAGKETDAAAQQILKNAGLDKPAAPEPAPAAPAKAASALETFMKAEGGTYPQFLGAMAEALQSNDTETAANLLKFNPAFAADLAKNMAPAMKAKAKAMGLLKDDAPKHPPPTPAEAEKAKKTNAVKLAYIPGQKPDSGEHMANAEAAVSAFNKKWEGKAPQGDAGVAEKVADFKQLTHVVNAIAANQHAQTAAEKEAQFKKTQDAIAAKAKAEKERLEKKFKEDPEFALHYEAMEELMGGKGASQQFRQQAAAQLKNSGLSKHLTPEAAMPIIAYSGSHYGVLNDQLRKGQMTMAQYKFAKSLNAGLDRLPAHTGTTFRKANISPEQLALYKPGMVVEERGFTSTSKSQGTWSGSTQYIVHGKTGRDISKISSHKSEQEVLFKSGTRFLVESVKGNEITLREV